MTSVRKDANFDKLDINIFVIQSNRTDVDDDVRISKDSMWGMGIVKSGPVTHYNEIDNINVTG